MRCKAQLLMLPTPAKFSCITNVWTRGSVEQSYISISSLEFPSSPVVLHPQSMQLGMHWRMDSGHATVHVSE